MCHLGTIPWSSEKKVLDPLELSYRWLLAVAIWTLGIEPESSVLLTESFLHPLIIFFVGVGEQRKGKHSQLRLAINYNSLNRQVYSCTEACS